MARRNEVRDFSKVVAAVKELSLLTGGSSLLELDPGTKTEVLEKLEEGKIESAVETISGGSSRLENAFSKLSKDDRKRFSAILKNVLAYDTKNAEAYFQAISDFLNEEGEKKRKGDLSLALMLNKLAGDTKTAREAIEDIISKVTSKEALEKVVQDAVKLYEGTKTETLPTQKKPLLEQLVAKVNTLEKLKTVVELKQGEEAAKRVDQLIFNVKAIVSLVVRGTANDTDIEKLKNSNLLTINESDKHPEEDSEVTDNEHNTKAKTLEGDDLVKKGSLKNNWDSILSKPSIKAIKNSGVKIVLAQLSKVFEWICRPFRSLLKTNESSAYLKERTTLLSVYIPTANQLNTLNTNTGSSVNTTSSETPSKESLKSFIQTLNNSSERAILKTLEENDINRKSKEPNSRVTLRKSSFLKERSLSLETDETRTTLVQKTLR